MFSIAVAGCAAKHDIGRRGADRIARQYLDSFVANAPKASEALGTVTVEQIDDGWSYRWSCKTNQASGLGVFVGRDGSSDYTEAPDCVG